MLSELDEEPTIDPQEAREPMEKRELPDFLRGGRPARVHPLFRPLPAALRAPAPGPEEGPSQEAVDALLRDFIKAKLFA